MSALWWVAALPALALFFTGLNAVTWPRGRRGGRAPGRVSVLIPARNEAETIEACVEHAMASAHPIHEVVIFDDQSDDDTPAILARLAERHPRLRVLSGDGLPAGWVGKPHACHRLAEAATGDVLVFVDADTRLTGEALERVASLMEDLRADVVTAVPRQQTGGFVERLVLPLLHLTYLSWFPLVLTHRSRNPRFLAANGQLLAVRRAAYDAVGGFESVRQRVVDDMAFCRRVKASGRTVVFADGHAMATTRMYRSAREVVSGFSKNIYAGVGARPAAILVVLALYGGAFLLPWVGLVVAAWHPEWLMVSLAGVAMNLAQRAVLAMRYRQPPESVVLHPLSVVAFILIALNSFFAWHARRRVQWRGRAYAPGEVS